MKNPVDDKKRRQSYAPAMQPRLRRGGKWDFYAWENRVSYRNRLTPSLRSYGVGLRLVRSKKNEKSSKR